MKHDYDPNCMCYRCKGIRYSVKYHSFRMKQGLKRKQFMHRARYLDAGPKNWNDR